ncbi:MAG: HAD family phosphatase [Verrucomicrobia subdivision 3 bacterium]|nr:HAD family phosphatase [Limisphaerales bacterium]
MTPQAVIFDLGKVLVDFDYSIAARALAARSRASPEEVSKLIDQSPLLVTYETGGLATKAFFERVCAATGFGGDIDEFGRLFGDIFRPIESMIQLHAELRAAGVPTYIFSNTNELAVAHIRRSFPFFSRFDEYIYSFQHGAMKPEEKIYRAVEHITRLTGQAILYLDDRADNVAAGRRRGWQVIHHLDPSTTRQLVTAAGLLKQV